jgi:phage tail protein X
MTTHTAAQIRARLLSGQTVTVTNPRTRKMEKIALATPEVRRLFALLVDMPADQRIEEEAFFIRLLEAYNGDSDPAAKKANAKQQAGDTDRSAWFLERVEAKNFGGLTTFNGPEFNYYVGGESWCLEGQNGSGKSSLASAIAFAMLGCRIQDQVGPVNDVTTRHPVRDADGLQIGTWPPVVTYPLDAVGLEGEAEVWVRLSFRNHAGDTATAERHMRFGLTDNQPELVTSIDLRLQSAPLLVECGVAMPARIAHLGFGDRSVSLFEAISRLTGLDDLAALGDFVANLCHGGRRFMKYAKDQNAPGHKATFNGAIEGAKRNLSEELAKSVVPSSPLGAAELPEALHNAARKLESEAAAHLALLADQLPASLNLTSSTVQKEIEAACIRAADVIRTSGKDTVQFFERMKQLAALSRAGDLAEARRASDTIEVKLKDGIQWHFRQEQDLRLRLKAVAAGSFQDRQDRVPDCPLCGESLSNDTKSDLLQDLRQLQDDAAAAQTRLQDLCAVLLRDVTAACPEVFRTELATFTQLDPKEEFQRTVSQRYGKGAPFATTLTGAVQAVEAAIAARGPALPSFGARIERPDIPAVPGTLQEGVSAVTDMIAALRCLDTLAVWWDQNRAAYVEVWLAVVGSWKDDGTVSADGLAQRVKKVQDALERARPYRIAAEQLNEAAKAATTWSRIMAEQRRREDVAESLAPLKGLRTLMAAVSSQTVHHLSGRVRAILTSIHYNERLSFHQAGLGKKEITAEGGFAEEMRIDATLVANSSWLRAILWGFILAIREQAIQSIGCNPFPLMVLDDPQLTFDPRNKRRWVATLCEMASSKSTSSAQIIVTSHEPKFCYLFNTEQLTGQFGALVSAHKAGRMVVANGLNFENLYNVALKECNDYVAREFIRGLRIHVEILLKAILHTELRDASASNIDGIRRMLRDLIDRRIVPYTRKPFDDLLKAIDGGGRDVRLLNEPPHGEDETIGIAEASTLWVWWERTRISLYKAYDEISHFNAYHGDPRFYTLPVANQNQEPQHKDTLGRIVIAHTGIVSAAASDGRDRLGWLRISEFDPSESPDGIRLADTDLVRLDAQTLEPVAGPGDVLILSNHAKINPNNLIVASVEDRQVARRYEKVAGAEDIGVLVAQSVSPGSISPPILLACVDIENRRSARKVIGVLFKVYDGLDCGDGEVAGLSDVSRPLAILASASLFTVQGRSAEPIALEGQFILAGDPVDPGTQLDALNGRPVIATNREGESCLKRLRLARRRMVILESLDMAGQESALLWTLDDTSDLSVLHSVRPALGVLFEKPMMGQKHDAKLSSQKEAKARSGNFVTI